MFHVVHLRRWGKHFGYEVYFDNSPCITMYDMKGRELKRRDAYRLARLLNGAMQ